MLLALSTEGKRIMERGFKILCSMKYDPVNRRTLLKLSLTPYFDPFLVTIVYSTSSVNYIFLSFLSLNCDAASL